MTTRKKTDPVHDDLRARALAVLEPLAPWKNRCHEAALRLVTCGIGDRVARGTCPSVGGQHSWAVVGSDCYDPAATIIDPTLVFHHRNPKAFGPLGIYVGPMKTHGHTPKGAGSIWRAGCPVAGSAPPIVLKPKQPLSRMAKAFLDTVGPLDYIGWCRLFSLPVGGWPAAEIIEAVLDTPTLRMAVPIDLVGMLTRRNPGDLYLRPVDTHR